MLALLPAYGCNYSFLGGSFPDHVRTLAVIPFENETTRLELTQDVHAVLLRDLPSALGVRSAGETSADAVIEGVITGYEVRTPNLRTGAGDQVEILQREVVVTVSVRIIDRVENVILWEGGNVRAEGAYLEAEQTEEDGKEVAIDLLVQRIVDGAQSNW